MKRILYFAMLTKLLTIASLAQDSRFRHYTVEDGLPSSTVYKIIQDAKGFMWFATEAGVARFDGYEFKIFTTQDGLANNTVLAIYEDREQRLWLVDNSRKLFYIQNDSVYPLIAGETHDFKAYDIFQDSDSTLWINTVSDGLIRCSRDGSYIEHIAPDALPEIVFALKQHNNGVKWFGTGSAFGSIKQIDGDLTIDQYLLHDSLEISSTVGITIKNNRVFGKTEAHIFEIFDSTYSMVFSLKRLPQLSRLASVQTDHAGNLLVASDNGAYLLDVNSFKLTTLIDSGAINMVYEDREENLWFSTYNTGIYFLSKNARSVQNFDSNNGLSDDAVTAIVADDYGNIYLGSANGHIHIYRNNEIHVTGFKEKSKNRINHISVMDSNEVWVGTHSGLVICDVNSLEASVWPEKTVRFKLDDDRPFIMNKQYRHLKISVIRAILPVDNSELLIGSTGDLIKVSVLPDYYLLNSLNFSDKINCLFRDKDSVLWIGSTNGLWRRDGEKYSRSQDARLSKVSITDIKADDQNILWIATSGQGLYAYRDSVLLHLNTDNGLAGNNIYNIDARDNIIWAATNKGLNRITVSGSAPKLTCHILLLNKQDGLIMDEVLSVYRHGDQVFAGTNKGLSVLQHSNIQIDSTAPPIYFQAFKIWNNDTALAPDYALKHNRNNITIKYVGLSYGSGKDISYKYKMEGIDHDWIRTAHREVSYPILPPGAYKFLVKAVNGDGVESKMPAAIGITINPPFWGTTWFRLSGGSVIILFVTLLFYLRNRQIRNKEKRNTEINKKIADFRMKAVHAQMNPHFMSNALNSVRNFIAGHDEESANRYLLRFSKLMRFILESSRNDTMLLEDELDGLRLYLELEALRFDGKLSYAIHLDEQVDPEDIEIPSLVIQPFVENAVLHGLGHGNARDELTINFKMEGQVLCCEIIDNGIGRQESEKLKKDSKKRRKSRAMAIIEEKLEIIRLTKNKKVEVNITDINEENGKIAGTKVTIRFEI